ncbi:MAG: helix-turn-helix transcriptional regulator [Bauldia sp.]|nr:helix-turn-helix transcriptional regulator [Bauldia sp.]
MQAIDVDGFERRSEEASILLTAMANRNRLLILCHLVGGELAVADLAARVSLSQSALSQHLAKLRAHRLVETRRDGQSVFYNLSSGAVRRVIETLYDIYCVPSAGRGKRAAGA